MYQIIYTETYPRNPTRQTPFKHSKDEPVASYIISDRKMKTHGKAYDWNSGTTQTETATKV